MNNHYAKFVKELKLLELQTPAHLTVKCLCSTPLKNEKVFVKCAQNWRCTSSICEQSMQSLNIKAPKSVADGWSGPITRHAFAKAMQVKMGEESLTRV